MRPRISSLLLAAGFSLGVHAQTTVDVDSGQTLTETDLLAGVFDGQPFTLDPLTTFEINSGGELGQVGAGFPGLTLFSLGGATLSINDGGSIHHNSALSDLSLELNTGGTTNVFSVFSNADVLIDGGSIAQNTTFDNGSEIELLSGNLGTFFFGSVTIQGGSSAVIQGGVAGGLLTVSDSSSLTVHEGLVRYESRIEDGSSLTVNGGIIESGLHISDSTLEVTGGRLEGIGTLSSSSMTWSGGVVQAPGDLSRSGNDVTLVGNELLTGPGFSAATLTDGTVAILSQDYLSVPSVIPVTLVPASIPPLDLTPIVVDSGVGPQSLRSGQSLTLEDGGSLPDGFTAAGADLLIRGGLVGLDIIVLNSNVTIEGGTFLGGVYGADIFATGESNVVINAGQIDDSIMISRDSSIAVNGGEIPNLRTASSDSRIHGGVVRFVDGFGGGLVVTGGHIELLHSSGMTLISGGTIGRPLPDSGYELSAWINGNHTTIVDVTGGEFLGVIGVGGYNLHPPFTPSKEGELRIHGGDFSNAGLVVGPGDVLELYVKDLQIDGVPMTLDVGVPVELAEREDQILTAALEDGTPFRLVLGHDQSEPGRITRIESDAIIRVIKVEPDCLADVNMDGEVTPTDFGAWLAAFNAGDPAADQNQDGEITPTDFGAWLANFNAGC